jgi:hypothetical protein
MPCSRTSRSRHRLLAAAALAIGLVGATETATAAPAWRPPLAVEASPSGTALSFPKVVARPAGCTTVAFERGGTVFASTRPPAGGFAPLQTLAPIAASEYPDLAVGGGVAAAVWEDTGSKVRIATASGCEALGAATQVPGSYAFTEDPVAAVDAAGTAVAAFQAGGSGSRKVHVSERPLGGMPGEPAPLAIPGGTEAFRPQLAANGVGGAGVAFDVVNAGNQVYGARRLGATGWSAPVQLNEAGKPAVAGSARVAMGGDGSPHAVWIDATNKKAILATLGPTGTVTRTTLAEVTGTVDEAAVAADAAGRVATAWVELAASVRTIKGKYLEPGGSFSPQRNVSSTASEFRGEPWVAIDRYGRTVVTWAATLSLGAIQRTMATTRSPGDASFAEQLPISDATRFTSPSDVGTDADGNTVVALFLTEAPRQAQVATFDAAGPLLGPISVPSGGAEDALPFSIPARDAWSPTVAAQWDFGDGTTGSGDSVSHAFTSAGSFAVRATVADALGNASEASGVSVVGPRPATPPASGPVAGDRPPFDPSPRLSRLKLAPPRFVLGSGPGRGAWLRYRLSESARVWFIVKRSGTRSFARSGVAGPNRHRFSGRLRGRALAPGSYVLKAFAVDSAGNRSQPRSVAFTILAD